MATGFEAPEGYKVGDEASDFSLQDITNKYVSMADYKDAKGFIVIFTCNHCPFSVAYEDRIIELDKTYKSKGYPVIAINPNDAKQYPSDSYEEMKKRAKKKKFTFPYLHDETQQIAKMYGATRTPHVFLLQKENEKFMVKYIGAIDDSARDPKGVEKTYLSNAIDALVAGKKIETDFTKAIGCSIKWKKD